MEDHRNLIRIFSHEDFKYQVNAAKVAKKNVVIHFTDKEDSLSGRVFFELSKQYPSLVYLKVDIDEQKEVAEEYVVGLAPVFVFLKDGAEIDRMVGAGPYTLEAKVIKFVQTT